jgi:hypothetical protein
MLSPCGGGKALNPLDVVGNDKDKNTELMAANQEYLIVVRNYELRTKATTGVNLGIPREISVVLAEPQWLVATIAAMEIKRSSSSVLMSVDSLKG